jgi:hypothetical protein
VFNKKGGALNVWTYMIVIFLIVIFTYFMINLGGIIQKSPHSALSTNSLEYYGNISNKTMGNLTAINDTAGNDSTDSAWSFALSFLRLDKKVNAVKDKVNTVLTFPSFMLYTVLDIPAGEGDIKFIVDTITNFISWAIFLALIYLLWK